MNSIADGTAEIVMYPVRFNILQFINQNNELQYVRQIAEAIKEHPRLVSHYLTVFQKIGLVEYIYEEVTAVIP